MALFFHSVVCSPSLLWNKQITSASSLMSLSRVQGSFDGVVAGSVFEAYLPITEVVDLGELFADRARVRDDPGRRARSRRTIWNRARSRRTVCDRARHGLAVSTGTKKVPQNPKSRNQTGTRLTSVHDATTEFPQILVRGSVLRGECDVSGESTGSVFKLHGLVPGTHL